MMKQKRKNRAFEFICAFLPGAAELYDGFFKCGFSLMVVFFACVWFAGVSETMVSGLLIAAMWFYGFFHARNLAHATDEEFNNMEDKAIWEEIAGFSFGLTGRKVRIGFSIALILIGISILWNMVIDTLVAWIPEKLWDYLYPILQDIPRFLIAVVTIMVGLRLIKGKKEEVYGIEDKQNS
ncbi:MAG: hypothetical protein II798_03390 [Lachnospiraceae bacterium]|nr:hypothetical protein [Lachnospiraceae bacterium]